MGFTPRQVAMKSLVFGWVTVCREVNHLFISNTNFNSFFYSSGVGRLKVRVHHFDGPLKICFRWQQTVLIQLCSSFNTDSNFNPDPNLTLFLIVAAFQNAGPLEWQVNVELSIGLSG